ncbi:MAG: hypothetical protein ABIQ35_01525 [Verrucomicrobiota bacterium]
MKNFINKVQDLGKKAAEIKQAIQSAPRKAAEIREALTMNAGELHQIRADVQANLNGLRANSPDRILRAMREVNDNTYTFEEAGYKLTGMDLDLTLNEKLAVHLQKFEDVPHVKLRALMAKESRETIKAILSGLLKAEESASNVEFTHLKYDGVVVHIGAVPLIRMCWRSDTLLQEQARAKVPESLPATPPPSSPSIGSFFEQRVIPASPVTAPVSQDLPVPVEPVPTVLPQTSIDFEPEKPSFSPWTSDALTRFKKMPDFSKHRSS